jgi:DtxR family Mn-dependent transcriptional regulator
MARPPLTDAIQDYLKDIYKLHAENGRATVTALAHRLRVSPASASAMVKKLAALELVAHAPYRGVALTPAGERVALEVIRHHRLLELYLADTLGLDVEDVHDEADRLEHVISEELEARIDQALGYPTHDPHGDPIPDRALRLVHPDERTLLELEPGSRASVARKGGQKDSGTTASFAFAVRLA